MQLFSIAYFHAAVVITDVNYNPLLGNKSISFIDYKYCDY